MTTTPRFRGRRRAAAALLFWLAATAVAQPVTAQTTVPGLSLSAPAAVSFGSQPLGGSFSAQLGQVRVVTSGSLLHSVNWGASVSTTGFTTGGGTAQETIPPSRVAYLAGAAALSGVTTCAAGQLTPTALTSTQTAYRCTGTSLGTSTSVTWNPTIRVTPAVDQAAGVYAGTITHTVA